MPGLSRPADFAAGLQAIGLACAPDHGPAKPVDRPGSHRLVGWLARTGFCRPLWPGGALGAAALLRPHGRPGHWSGGYAPDLASQVDPTDPAEWVEPLLRLAGQVVAVYGQPCAYVDFAAFQAEVRLKQKWLAQFEAEQDQLRLKLVRPLYRRLHPSRHLESLYGLGQDSAAVFLSFVGQPGRFADGRHFRGWSGLTPRSAQSSRREAKGLPISQAGPDLVKKYAFLDADVARRYDPQLAKIYYEQMVHKGRPHTQAVCAVATHLLDRILVVLQQDRPYQLRDVDGRPVTPEQARQIIADKYTVPDEVRQRNKRRTRQERADQHAERAFQRRQQHEGKLASSVRG